MTDDDYTQFYLQIQTLVQTQIEMYKAHLGYLTGKIKKHKTKVQDLTVLIKPEYSQIVLNQDLLRLEYDKHQKSVKKINKKFAEAEKTMNGLKNLFPCRHLLLGCKWESDDCDLHRIRDFADVECGYYNYCELCHKLGEKYYYEFFQEEYEETECKDLPDDNEFYQNLTTLVSEKINACKLLLPDLDEQIQEHHQKVVEYNLLLNLNRSSREVFEKLRHHQNQLDSATCTKKKIETRIKRMSHLLLNNDDDSI